MEPFHAALFMRVMQMGGIALTRDIWRQTFPPPEHIDVYEEDAKDAYDQFLDQFEKGCIELELIGSLASVRRLRSALAQPNSLYTQLMPIEIELGGRLIDEMTAKSLWMLTIKEAELYKSPRKRWEEIIDRFPDALTDVEEASKCFALSRSAAAVFHSTQVVEAGLIELGRFLKVTDPKSGWTAVTIALDKTVKKQRKDMTRFERNNFAFLEQIHGTAESLKNAWRNKISHAHGRLTLMTRDFGPEVAEEILFATRAFMRRLAEGLPPSKDKKDKG